MLAESKHAALSFTLQSCLLLQPNILLGDGYIIHSSRGVKQEDVCGPALFAIALHTIVLRLQELHLELNVWYLDDGIQ